MKKIIVTGATGFIGKKICRKLIERGDEVTVFSRDAETAKLIIPDAACYVNWDWKKINDEENSTWINSLEGKDGIIHLAGEGILNKRWNEKHKKNIRDSRVLGTRAIVDGIKKIKNKPAVFVCASAIGYYGNSLTETFDESSPPGNDFLARVVVEWEKEAAEIEKQNIRRVSVRTGIVLDKEEGALAKMIVPFKYFVGGPIGSGRQWMSWIHIDDLVNIFIRALDDEKICGAINAVAPNPVTMNEFAKTLGHIMKRPALFRVPAFVLKILYGEGAQVVLGGQRVETKHNNQLCQIVNHHKLI